MLHHGAAASKDKEQQEINTNKSKEASSVVEAITNCLNRDLEDLKINKMELIMNY